MRRRVTLGLAALRATGLGALALLIWNPAAVRVGAGDGPRLVLLDASLSMAGHGGALRPGLDQAPAPAHRGRILPVFARRRAPGTPLHPGRAPPPPPAPSPVHGRRRGR